MSYATEPLMENAQRQSDFILIALLISIGLHSTAIGFLPGFGKSPAPLTPPPLTVELVTPEAPPPPPPIKEPEPEKPQPKPEPKPTPVSQPPKPAPVQKVLTPEPPPTSSPRNEPPPTPAAETAKPVEPSPQPVIAVEQKFNEPPPTSTVSAQTPVAPQESDANHKAAIVGYGNQLTTEMSKNQNYPKRAKEKNWTGKGRILLKYDPKSKKFSYVISQTSGRAILDDDAKQNLQNALSSVPPTGLVADIPFEVEIPFVYRLEISQ
ncbi:MAG: energy transducer TonB [Methylophilales bacterium]|nr:energy transducer TonB [Methylophilales bacterium]